MIGSCAHLQKSQSKARLGLKCRPKLAFVISEDWLFTTHFLPVARAALDIGFEVVVVARDSGQRDAIESQGFRFLPLDSERHSVNPVSLICYLLRLCNIIRTERPTVVHAVSLKQVIFGGLAATFTSVPAIVLSPIGLGFLWMENGLIQRVARSVVRLIARWFARRKNTAFIFENPDDRTELGLDTAPAYRARVIGGWGIESDALLPTPAPTQGPVRLAYLGRMLKTKGIAEMVEAVRQARTEGLSIELELWGAPDSGSLTSYTTEELKHFNSLEGITWQGWAPAVADVWSHSHIGILLSKREGMPRSIIEAMACGRPVITTDAPGCRFAIHDGVTGIQVPIGEPEVLSKAIARLVIDRELRERMGAAARRDFEARFTVEKVVPHITSVYLSLLKPHCSEGTWTTL